MGFRTSGTGTSTGNGTAISGTGKLRWALTHVHAQICACTAQTDMHISPIPSLSHPHHGHNYLINPHTKSPPPKSILVRFGPVKWQNLSTAPDERVCHLQIAVIASPPPRNQPQNEKYFDFVPLLPLDQIGSHKVNSCPFWTW